MTEELWCIGTLVDHDRWMVEGITKTEEEAITLVKEEDEFIVLVDLGRFPVKAKDAKRLYWPKRETWEQSKLFLHQENKGSSQ